jgi:hypothetical protein
MTYLQNYNRFEGRKRERRGRRRIGEGVGERDERGTSFAIRSSQGKIWNACVQMRVSGEEVTGLMEVLLSFLLEKNGKRDRDFADGTLGTSCCENILAQVNQIQIRI